MLSDPSAVLGALPLAVNNEELVSFILDSKTAWFTANWLTDA